MNDYRYVAYGGTGSFMCHDGNEHQWRYVGEQAEKRELATCVRCKGITPNRMHPGGNQAMHDELVRRYGEWHTQYSGPPFTVTIVDGR